MEISGIWKKSPARGQSHELQVSDFSVSDEPVKVVGEVDPQVQFHLGVLVALIPTNTDTAQTYPIQKKYHTSEFLRSIPHLRVRTPFNSLLSRFRSEVLFAVSDFFRTRKEHGPFYQIQPPLVTSSDCEGAGEVFTLAPKDMTEKDEQFFKDSKYLTVSSQLHLEAYSAELGSVWTLSPTFRAERSDTPRHLAEFYMLEVEVRNTSNLEAVMRLAEDMIKHVVSVVQSTNIGQEVLAAKRSGEGGIEASPEVDSSPDGESMQGLKRRWDAISQPQRWRRITYTEAMNHLERSEESTQFQYQPSWSTGLQLEHERWLVEHLGNGGPLFVTDYPKAVKPFYMLPSTEDADNVSTGNPPGDKQTVANFDLLFPHVAELVGGSLREHRLPALITNMRDHGLIRRTSNNATATSDTTPPSELKYPHLEPGESLGSLQWYADLRQYGSMPHGGFGLGFDRLLMYLTGVTNVRDVVGFPRYWGRADC